MKGIIEARYDRMIQQQADEAARLAKAHGWDEEKGGFGDKIKVIKVAMPTSGNFSWQAVLGLLSLNELGPVTHPETGITYYMWVALEQSSLIYKNRNDLADIRGQKDPYHWFDYLMFIDSDMVWETEWIINLAILDLPVVGALAVRKGWPYRPTIFMENPKQPGQLMVPMINPQKFVEMEKQVENIKGSINRARARCMRVAGIGTGFTMIRRDVLQQIPPPWFFHDIRLPNPGEEEDYDVLKNTRGEDVYFCLKCKERGIPVFVDLGMHVGHEGQYIFDIRDHFDACATRGEQLQESGIDPESIQPDFLPTEGLDKDGSATVRDAGQVAASG